VSIAQESAFFATTVAEPQVQRRSR